MPSHAPSSRTLQVGEKASELRRGMIAMKDDATSLVVIYGVSLSGLALSSYFLFRSRAAQRPHDNSGVTRAPQPKYVGVQLHSQRHHVTAAWNE
jgi:hypothetical protein